MGMNIASGRFLGGYSACVCLCVLIRAEPWTANGLIEGVFPLGRGIGSWGK